MCLGKEIVLSFETEKERAIFNIWCNLYPVRAYAFGVQGVKGKFYVPSKSNITRSIKEIHSVLKGCRDPVGRKILRSMESMLVNLEPHNVPSDAMWAIFYYIVKGDTGPRDLVPLLNNIVEAFKACELRFHRKKYPIEIRLLTYNASMGLKGVLSVIERTSESSEVMDALNTLYHVLDIYIEPYIIDGVDKGLYEDAYPALIDSGGPYIKRKGVYPTILRDQFDYIETPNIIESRAMRWLNIELPILKHCIEALADIYGCSDKMADVEVAIVNKRQIPQKKVLDYVFNIRTVLRGVVEQHLVRITPRYITEVVSTPDYLVPFIPTAAMTSLGLLTANPRNVFFVTSWENSQISIPDLIQMIVHEEFGHCVNFTNSAVGYGYRCRGIEMLATNIYRPITEGISFYREMEFLNLMDDIVTRFEQNKRMTKIERTFIDTILNLYNDDLVAAMYEMEFVVYKWRIIRYLRAICDVRINMGKMPFVQFVEWASEYTAIEKREIYNQNIIFQKTPGYAPCYSFGGDTIAEINNIASAHGIRKIDINTVISARGFPPRSIFLEWFKKNMSKLKALDLGGKR